jgi:hypothetical protein
MSRLGAGLFLRPSNISAKCERYRPPSVILRKEITDIASVRERAGMSKLPSFGPSREEIENIARDLIIRHGADAYDEAVHLSKIARFLLGSSSRSQLYRAAAIRIEVLLADAREPVRLKRPARGN